MRLCISYLRRIDGSLTMVAYRDRKLVLLFSFSRPIITLGRIDRSRINVKTFERWLSSKYEYYIGSVRIESVP